MLLVQGLDIVCVHGLMCYSCICCLVFYCVYSLGLTDFIVFRVLLLEVFWIYGCVGLL